MYQITASTLSRLLKSAFSPFRATSAHDAHGERVEPTLAPDGDSAFAARCERRLDEALTVTSRIR